MCLNWRMQNALRITKVHIECVTARSQDVFFAEATVLFGEYIGRKKFIAEINGNRKFYRKNFTVFE